MRIFLARDSVYLLFPSFFFFLSQDEARARALHATVLMQSEKYAAHVGGEIMHFSFHRACNAFIRGRRGARVVFPSRST
jgi:hypothetical protein